ncbi:MAG: primosomal protein N', partial [Eubacterium sp.]|nr:primosomal protein N' [Eubacterium sp.]
MYANIIVDISHEQLDKTFQYHVPDALLSQIDTGVMVNIPFGRGNRIITGYVIELTSKAEFDEERIKDIDSVVPNRVKAVEDMIKLAAWLKHNYGGTMNQALKTVIPVKEKIRQKEKKHIKLNVTKEEA